MILQVSCQVVWGNFGDDRMLRSLLAILLLFEVVLRRGAQRRVFLDIRGEPARLLEAKHPVNINQVHAVLEVEAQVELMHQVLAFRQKVWNELRGLCRARHFVVRAELHLVLTQHLHLHIEALRCQWE